MSADIQQVQGQQVIVDPDDIEGIPGEFVTGPVRPGEIKTIDLRQAFWQQCLLNASLNCCVMLLNAMEKFPMKSTCWPRSPSAICWVFQVRWRRLA